MGDRGRIARRAIPGEPRPDGGRVAVLTLIGLLLAWMIAGLLGLTWLSWSLPTAAGL